MSRISVGVVGAGRIAERHLEVLQAFDDVDLVALCNRGGPGLQELATRFGVRKTYTDFPTLLDDGIADALLVLVSVTAVAEVAEECLRRGIPSLIEKPPGLSSAETRRLADIAGSVVNMVALNRRFYGVMRAAASEIRDRGPLMAIAVEAPERISDSRRPGISHPPDVVERFLVANGIHCIDLLRYFGGEVSSVRSASRRWFEDQKDSFAALLEFENGAIGQYASHWSAPGVWSVTLYGRNRRVSIAPLERGVVIERDGSERILDEDPADIAFKPGLYAQNRYFLDRIRGDRPVEWPACDLRDGVKTMELIEAIAGGFP
jgi:predicted dehydrogenase